MATISAATNEAVYRIEKFLGLNENPDGDNKLKLGEATKCENWKVTRDLNLKRRPGTHTLFTLGNSPVKGLWSGNVNGTKMTLAACNGHLWKIRENDSYLETPEDLGEFDTTNRVNFFAYSNIVYILNGEEYMQYDGVSFKQVTGYIPVVAVSRTPSGSSSTMLEEVNKLNNMRRVWFSPDGKDNVFALPEKDVLSVHYVKNLGTGEYFDPAEYNIDRMNGTVTFGTDDEIVYDGENDTYTIENEDITDVGQIEINGEVPTVSYTVDLDGVTFSEMPKYGQVVTVTTGEEFSEEFTGDGETTEFEAVNAGMKSYEISVDGVEQNVEPLFENHFQPGQASSYLEMKYSVEVNDVFDFTIEEDAEFAKTVTIAANASSANLALPSWFINGRVPYKTTVKYNSSGEELPEYENIRATICPYPEALQIDDEAFTNAYNENILSNMQISSYVDQSELHFCYIASENKWKVTDEENRWSFADSHFSDQSFTDTSSREIVFRSTGIALDNMHSSCIVVVALNSAFSTTPLTLIAGEDYTVEVTSEVTISDEVHSVYTIHLAKSIDEIYESFAGSHPTEVSITPYFVHAGEYALYPDLVNLEDYGITYEPSLPSSGNDIIIIRFARNFVYDPNAGKFYIKPHGSAVTSQTKFIVTLHDKGNSTFRRTYGAGEQVYYDNVFRSSIVGSDYTGGSQISFDVRVNGRLYREAGDYSIVGNKITFTDAPAEGAVIHIDETHDVIEKTFYVDGETNTFTVGFVGAKTITATLDDQAAETDRKFSFNPETMEITILDNEGLEAGDVITVKGKKAPARGTNTIEICYSAGMAFTQSVNRMTNAEIYLGVQDNAVFLYGDGSNKAFYSGIDYNGQPRADYFPDLNEMAVADTNTPITAMIRHYSQLICFKSKSAYTVQYGIITQADGIQQYGFYITPINKEIGCSALGQVRLVLNSPYVLYGDDLYKWTSNSRYSASLSADERNAFRVSDRIYATLAQFNTVECYCYDDNFGQEYYIWYGNRALVYNYASDAWYVYSGLNVTAMCNIDEIVLAGTEDGKVIAMSEEYTNDDGTAFDSYWESGSLDFGKNYIRKFMSELWVGLKPDPKYSVTVSGRTEKKELLAVKEVSGEAGTNLTPFIKKLKIKAKKFAFLKLILESNKDDSTATVVSLATKIRETGFIK